MQYALIFYDLQLILAYMVLRRGGAKWRREGRQPMAVTVLIVDDNAQFRVLLREIVAAEPDCHVVGEAADGAEAMRLAQELRPDILLLDLGMPRVNGLEVLRWSKAERPASKVIIVTGHTEDAYRQAAETSGADAFLLKRTLGTVLVPTLQRLRASLAPPQAPQVVDP
jgi:two-component system, NarL family, response regulator DesR